MLYDVKLNIPLYNSRKDEDTIQYRFISIVKIALLSEIAKVMAEISRKPIYRFKVKTQTLVDAYPPKFINENKKIVYSISCPNECIHKGQLIVSRWAAMPLPQTLSLVNNQTKLKVKEGYFRYDSSQQNEFEWYLNFAHSDLFCAYDGSLFAQDEMQVAEHPALGSLREAMLDKNMKTLTVEDGEPTPILIRGVERRCEVAIAPNLEEDRPYGLYGNNFARAKSEAIKKATKALNPPTITNIIAMEAPCYGYGVYKIEEIEYILITAFTGFSAAYIESQLGFTQQKSTIIHTGFWGCGAYGGNRILMALLQLLAARLSRVKCLVFHTGDATGVQALATAKQILDRCLQTDNLQVEVSDLIE